MGEALLRKRVASYRKKNETFTGIVLNVSGCPVVTVHTKPTAAV